MLNTGFSSGIQKLSDINPLLVVFVPSFPGLQTLNPLCWPKGCPHLTQDMSCRMCVGPPIISSFLLIALWPHTFLLVCFLDFSMIILQMYIQNNPDHIQNEYMTRELQHKVNQKSAEKTPWGSNTTNISRHQLSRWWVDSYSLEINVFYSLFSSQTVFVKVFLI